MLKRSASILCGSMMMLFVAQAAESGKTEGAKQVTFSKDVAPIFEKSCMSCHHPGTMTPMSLMTYAEARPWAKSIKERVVRRDMPPWHLDKTVGIREYKNDRSLNDDEIATIARWVDNGTPEGGVQLHEFAVGKYGDIFADNTGRLLKKGTRLRFDMHYFAVGSAEHNKTTIAFKFYPKGETPKYQVRSIAIRNVPNDELE